LVTPPSTSDGKEEAENKWQTDPLSLTPTSPTNRTSLHLGAEKGHTKIVQILLNSGASIDSVDIAGRTALHCAVESRKLEVVRVLLERGADAKRKDANGMSVLHLAVDKGYEDIVLLLIEKGIDPNS
jgi:ankyrin repeat protein